ncbi:lysozyme inhibitor LprI family protein [Pseudoduganella namucuonensis]|uniref:Lysozyme inhibitor LprI-like N-terminal domain-containing protein n=1 Tax=Pseudoduganella namucuonensis TaxID=1035707 RepID=A0A1I7FGE6_9BURK|nr:lysozyme inhibitor LprI family protein [Pseudoduganella namucuonensis]SFU35185.1 Protein of unknown function [Pseudoduganella namucuonensis]
MSLPTARALALGALALLAWPASAQPPEYPNTSAMGSMGDTGAAWYRQCLAVRNAQPPAREVPPARLLHGLRNCGAQDRYYDTRQLSSPSPAAWEQVRHCAYAEDDAAVLMMLYANGYGVSPSPELALRYACSMAAAPAEMDGRVAHLGDRATRRDDAPFDQCDDATSGHMGGVCAQIRERLDRKARSARLMAILKSWPAPQQAAAAQLQQALDAFADQRAEQETDQSGTLRAAISSEARSAELDLFARDLQDAEKGRVPRYTARQFAQLDKKMNAMYVRLMQRSTAHDAPQELGFGTVTKDGVRATQLAWLAYRDAWVALGAARYPGVAAHAWKALLTQRRIEQLAEFES